MQRWSVCLLLIVFSHNPSADSVSVSSWACVVPSLVGFLLMFASYSTTNNMLSANVSVQVELILEQLGLVREQRESMVRRRSPEPVGR